MDKMLTGATAFDPSEVILLLGGFEPYGYADDTKITVAKTGDIITPYSGTDGDVSLALQRNKLGTMTISLQSTSGANEVFCSWHEQMYLTRIVAFPVYLSDPKGFSIQTFGWIQSQPDMSIGNEIGTVDWVIGLKDATVTRGFGVSTGLGALNGIKGLIPG